MISLVQRIDMEIRCDPARVISRAFDPGQEGLIQGLSRAQSVIKRLMSFSDEQVSEILAHTLAAYATRHDDLRAHFRRNYQLVTHGDPLVHPELTQDRVELIGAYFTQEYAIEGAALFNPSIVPAPDQSGCEPGQLRFIMSLRAVGEGHLSSIEFRSGLLTADNQVLLDSASPHLSTGERSEVPSNWGFHETPPGAGEGEREYPALPPDAAITLVAASHEVSFAPTSTLSERVLFPGGGAESHGLEDARMVRFVEDDGNVVYYGTYTAYDGAHVAPYVFRTADFLKFDMRPMLGDAAKNKGMALFPRRIHDRLWCLSRWDRESISIAHFEDGRGWTHAQSIQAPSEPWDLVQMGICSSPIELPEGWLVLTHGVGPMRSYALGAMLLDLDDPTKLIGALATPLLVPAEAEREGYVPNVVYSCGALVHGGLLVLPYGCSDDLVRFAFVDLAGLISHLSDPARMAIDTVDL